MITWKNIETVMMHVVAVAVMLFALWIAVTPVKAHPRHSCHQHNTVTHCH